MHVTSSVLSVNNLHVAVGDKKIVRGIDLKIIAGEINCAVCGCQVDLDNLGSVFPEGDEIRVTCDSDRCVRTVTIRGPGALSG